MARQSAHWRSTRPRHQRITLSLTRRVLGLCIIGVLALLGGAFGLGLHLGSARVAPSIAESTRVTAEPAALGPQPVPDPRPGSLPSGSSPAVIAPVALAPKIDLEIGPAKSSSAYGIQIGAYPNLSTAQHFVSEHAESLQGYKVFVVPTEIRGRGVWHRVRVGAFPSRAEAEEARQKMPDGLAKNAMVVSYK